MPPTGQVSNSYLPPTPPSRPTSGVPTFNSSNTEPQSGIKIAPPPALLSSISDFSKNGLKKTLTNDKSSGLIAAGVEKPLVSPMAPNSASLPASPFANSGGNKYFILA